jgi:hypothetical protein
LENSGSPIITIVSILLGFALTIFLLWLPVPMAEKRGRSTWGWFFIGILINPFLAMFILWVIGNKREN